MKKKSIYYANMKKEDKTMKKHKANVLLQKSFDRLAHQQKTPFDESNTYFTTNLPASKALRIILFKLLLNILYYQKRVLESHEEEDLHQLRVNIRKSRAFIRTFHFLFKKGLDVLLLTQLSKIASQTNKKRDLDVIKEELEKNIEKESKLYGKIEAQIEKEKNKIGAMLQNSMLEDFFKDYKQVLLEGEHLFVKHKNDTKINKSAKLAIRSLHQNIIKRIKKLQKHFSVVKLHKIRIAFKKLRYLLEEFQHIYDQKHIASDIKEIKELQTLLGDFNDTINQKQLLTEYFNTPDMRESSISHEALLEITSHKEQAIIQEVLKNLKEYQTKQLVF